MRDRIFYILKCNSGISSGAVFETDEISLPLDPGRDYDKVDSRIKIGTSPLVAGFRPAKVIHRWVQNMRIDPNVRWLMPSTTGRRLTRVDYLIMERVFKAHYNKVTGLFIANAERKIVQDVVKDFNSALIQGFVLRRRTLDLNGVKTDIEGIKGAQFKGIWLKRQPGGPPIDSQGAYGGAVLSDRETRLQANQGLITSLSLVWPLAKLGFTVRVWVTSGGSVYFLAKYSLEEQLTFIEYLAENY